MRRWLAVVLCGFFLSSALAQTASSALPEGVVQASTVEGITEYRLANGLKVLLAPDASKPTVTVNMTYLVGSRLESYGETGMAHLLEHLIFKGTPTTADPLGEFSKRGMRANGTTWYDRTNYFASFSANDAHLQWYLSWQADAMIHSHIAKDALDSEMTVVRNEMEMGENSAFRVLWEKTAAAAYQWHNYGHATIGARADVENVDIARLQAFYRKYYQPDNAVLSIAGKFEPAKVLTWVKDSFGPIPHPGRTLDPTYTLEPVQDGERRVTLQRAGGTPLMLGLYHVMPGAHPDYAAVALINQILGDGPSSRLHQSLVEKRLAAEAFSFSFPLNEPGYTLFGVALAPGQAPEAAREAFLHTVEGVRETPFTAEELARAKAQWLKDWEMSFSDPERVGVSLSESIALGDWRLFFLLRDRIRSAKLEEVQRVANTYLLPSNRTLGMYLPTDKPLRAPRPQRVADVGAYLKDYQGDASFTAGEAFEATPQNIEARTQRSALPNGLKLALLPKTTRNQRVNASLRLHFGTVASLQGKTQIGALVAQMLDRGTPSLSRQQIQDRLDQLKAKLSIDGGADGVDLHMVTTREHLPALIRLVAQLLRESSFPAEQLDEVKRLALTELEEARKQPSAVVGNALARHGNPYPRTDPRYARTFDEIAHDIEAVKVEEVRAFHRQFYGANQAEFAAVGDFDKAVLTQALTQGLGNWSSQSAYARIPNPLVQVAAADLKFGTPDKQNAFFQAQLPIALKDSDAEYPTLMLVNYVLGQVGDSRLWKRLRQQEGLSYDVRSTIDWSQHEPNSMWRFQAIYAPQNAAKLLKGFEEELARYIKDGLSASELKTAVAGLLSARHLARAQDGVLAMALANNLEVGRTMALSAQVDAKLAALRLDEVNAALRAYLKPELFVKAVAGDFQQDSAPAPKPSPASGTPARD